MLRFFFFVLIFSLSAFPVFAEEKAVMSSVEPKIQVRHFDKEQLKEYAEDSDFQYGDVKIDTSPSLWQRFWSWFWSLFGKTVSNAASGGFFKYVFIILGCSAIVFAVLKLIGMDARMIFTGKSKSIELPYEESLEDIHQISFDAEITNAIERKDFRLAIRMMYLKSLKKLSDGGKIKWKPGKTNAEYIAEIKHDGQKSKFATLTRQFEYAWYGSFPVDAGSFTKISTEFREFYQGTYK